MKAGREHRVPLADEVVELLGALLRFEGSEYLFPSPRTGRPLSDAALGKVLRDLGFSVTAHGFRSSFRDWAAERTAFQNHVCELALAHSIGDKVEASYQAWRPARRRGASSCRRGPRTARLHRQSGEVVPIRGAR